MVAHGASPAAHTMVWAPMVQAIQADRQCVASAFCAQTCIFCIVATAYRAAGYLAAPGHFQFPESPFEPPGNRLGLSDGPASVAL